MINDQSIENAINFILSQCPSLTLQEIEKANESLLKYNIIYTLGGKSENKESNFSHVEVLGYLAGVTTTYKMLSNSEIAFDTKNLAVIGKTKGIDFSYKAVLIEEETSWDF